MGKVTPKDLWVLKMSSWGKKDLWVDPMSPQMVS